MSPPERWLLVSSYFPPRAGGSSTVYRTLLSHLDQTRIDVLTAPSPPQLSEHHANLRCRVHTAGIDWPWVRGQIYLDLFMIPFVAWRGVRIVRRAKSRCILATHPEVTFLAAAYLIHLFTRVPIVPYLHDTIVEGQRRAPYRVLARWVQPRLFFASRRILVLSGALQELYRRKYGVETVVITHCVDDAVLGPDTGLGVRSELSVVGFTGAIYSLNIDSIERMDRALAKTSDVRFVVCSPGGASPAFTAERAEFAFIKDRPGVLAFQRECSVLYLPLAFDYRGGRDEISTVVPTKLFEYLASGTPILVHAPAYCFLTEWARSEGFALVVDEPDEGALLEAVLQLLDPRGPGADLVANARRLAKRYRGPPVAACFEAALFGEQSSAWRGEE